MARPWHEAGRRYAGYNPILPRFPDQGGYKQMTQRHAGEASGGFGQELSNLLFRIPFLLHTGELRALIGQRLISQRIHVISYKRRG
jgi:hypothetical protein